MKRKILSLFLAITLALVLGTAFNPVSHAESQSVYQFDAVSITESGVTITLDETTQQWTLDGNATGDFTYSYGDLYTANVLGYSLNTTSYYAVVYEYISGTHNLGSGTSSVFRSVPTNQFYSVNMFVNNSSTKPDLYQVNQTVLLRPNDADPVMAIDADGTFNNLVYKLHFIEIDPTTTEVAMFTDLTSVTDGTSTVDFTANTMTYNLTEADNITIDLTSKINSAIIDSDTLYMVAIDQTSTGTFSINSLDLTLSNSLMNDTYASSTLGVAYVDDIDYSGFWAENIETVSCKANVYEVSEASTITYEFNVFEVAFDVTYQTVSYDIDGVIDSTDEVLYGTYATAPTDPTKTDYTFLGWYDAATGGSVFNFASTPITDDITLYARFVSDSETIRVVSFDVDGGSAIDPVNVVDGEAVAEPSNPTKTGYSFVGWYSDATLLTAYEFTTAVTADLTLYAKWAESTVVTPVSDGIDPDTLFIIITSSIGGVALLGLGAYVYFSTKNPSLKKSGSR